MYDLFKNSKSSVKTHPSSCIEKGQPFNLTSSFLGVHYILNSPRESRLSISVDHYSIGHVDILQLTGKLI